MVEDKSVLQSMEGSSLSSHGTIFRSMAIVEDGTLLQAMEGSSLASPGTIFGSMAMVEDELSCRL
jgi:hypothetical protein